MRGFEGADNGKVAHDDDKEGEEDATDDQDRERYRGGVRGGEDGAGSWWAGEIDEFGEICQSKNSFTGFT